MNEIEMDRDEIKANFDIESEEKYMPSSKNSEIAKSCDLLIHRSRIPK